MKYEKVVKMSLIGVIFIGIIVISLTYALWQINKNQTGENVVNSACLDISLDNELNDILLDNAYPLSDEEGLDLLPYSFSVTNRCKEYNSYTINLEMLDITNLNSDYVRIALNEEGNLKTLDVLGNYPSYAVDVKEGRTIANGSLGPLESKYYELRIWIDKDVTVSDDVMSKRYQSKVVIKSRVGNRFDEACYNPDSIGCKLMKNDVNEDLVYDDTVDRNLRYTGANPNNYLYFNCDDYESQDSCEKWRIIGLMKVKTSNGKTEERLKIVRTNNIDGQNDFPGQSWNEYTENNNWIEASLNDLLNNSYYNGNEIVDNLEEKDGVKGLSSTSKVFIDRDVTWSFGAVDGAFYLAKDFYVRERGSNDNYSNEWSINNDSDLHNGLGLFYPSDYGYAVGGEVRTSCLEQNLGDWSSDCTMNDWLFPDDTTLYYWTFTPYSLNDYSVFWVSNFVNLGYYNVYSPNDALYGYYGVAPVSYLVSDVKLLDNPFSDLEYGSFDNPFRIGL